MKSFTITYTEGNDIPQTAIFRGYDAEHAESRFMDSMSEEGGEQGLRVLSVTFNKPSKRVPCFA